MDDVGPEARAVLADAPTFVLDATHGGRNLELPLRLPGRLVRVRIELPEVVADDLVRLVALDPLGPRSSTTGPSRMCR